MEDSSTFFTPREAARMLGISYPAIKQWILKGKLETRTTPGGHHRVPASALKPFLDAESSKDPIDSRERFRKISGRNQLVGKVISIRIDGLFAEVVLAVEGQHVTAIITAEAVREMALQKGDTAAALIKSTSIMVERTESPL